MAQKKKEQATVLMQQEIAPGIYDCRIRTGLARESAPGQFIAVLSLIHISEPTRH